MLNVDEIQNGVVIDHITAGTGMALYHLMELEKLPCASVALLQNVRSQKSGKKDIIKIEGDVSRLNFDVLRGRIPREAVNRNRFVESGRHAACAGGCRPVFVCGSMRRQCAIFTKT